MRPRENVGCRELVRELTKHLNKPHNARSGFPRAL